MEKTYVEQRDNGFWVTGTRISLDSIVTAFKRGASPETIKRSFPLLALEEIYDALTFYLAHQSEIDDYLNESEKQLATEAEARQTTLRETKPGLIERVRKISEESKVVA